MRPGDDLEDVVNLKQMTPALIYGACFLTLSVFYLIHQIKSRIDKFPDFTESRSKKQKGGCRVQTNVHSHERYCKICVGKAKFCTFSPHCIGLFSTSFPWKE